MKKLLVSLLLASIGITDCYAQEKIITLEQQPESKMYFEIIGKGFVALKDNKYLIDKGLIQANGAGLYLTPFLTTPNSDDCKSSESCIRKEINGDKKFTIESFVAPKFPESESLKKDKLDCEHNIIFCYVKLKFEDGDVAYMGYMDFDKASNPITAIVSRKPSVLQIIPISPSKKWKKDKADYDRFVKKGGVTEGYTPEQVLKSSWGKPSSRTRSSSSNSNIEVWSYSNGAMLGFVNGYLTQITTVN